MATEQLEIGGQDYELQKRLGISTEELFPVGDKKTSAKKKINGKKVDELTLNLLEALGETVLDPERVDQVVRESLEKLAPRRIEIYQGTEKLGSLASSSHYLLGLTLPVVFCGVNLYLTGEAGSGKTRLAIDTAKGLGREFEIMALSPLTTKSDLMGFIDAHGKYQPSALYRCMKDGKILVLDEIDTADAGVLLQINAAIESKIVTFPNGETLEAKEGFQVIACGNTYGNGADVNYSGRQKLDLATLDRYFFLYVPVDINILNSFVGRKITMPVPEIFKGTTCNDATWADVVDKSKEFLKKYSIDKYIGARAYKYGAILTRAKIPTRWLVKGFICPTLSPENEKTLFSELRVILPDITQ